MAAAGKPLEAPARALEAALHAPHLEAAAADVSQVVSALSSECQLLSVQLCLGPQHILPHKKATAAAVSQVVSALSSASPSCCDCKDLQRSPHTATGLQYVTSKRDSLWFSDSCNRTSGVWFLDFELCPLHSMGTSGSVRPAIHQILRTTAHAVQSADIRTCCA